MLRESMRKAAFAVAHDHGVGAGGAQRAHGVLEALTLRH